MDTHAHSTFLDRLLRISPPPRYLEMPAAGLDLSDEVVRFVSLRPNHRTHYFDVVAFGEKKIPKELVEEGFIKNKDELVKALSEFRKEHNLNFVTVSLPEEKAYLFRTTVPMMDTADIRDALQFKIEENVPIQLMNAIYDYKIVKVPDPKDDHIDLAVTVIHTKVVNNYLEVFHGAGFTPLWMPLESHAVGRAVVERGDMSAYLTVTVRETKTVLSIVARGAVQFTSTLQIGAQSFASSVQKNFSVDKGEADKITRGLESKESNEMFLSLVNAGSVLRDEIQKLMMYWDSHSLETGPQKAIQKIILTGSAVLSGLDDYLMRSLSIPVVIANAWSNVLPVGQKLPPLTLRESLDYVPAIGLAIP